MAGSLKFDTWLNDDSTENYKCRAFVNFNGTGTVAIRASGNVSSITDNGTGDYTVNFTNTMPDADYCIAGASDWTGLTRGAIINPNTYLTTSIRINTVRSDFSPIDSTFINLAIFR